jgi:[lysine-biosynthesis-protein LysW]--L-2-aminoadipate ligase
MKIGFLHSLLRPDEKLLLDEFRKRNIELVKIDDRKLQFNLGKDYIDVDIVVERCINHSRALHALRLLEISGIKCINSFSVASICGDKLLTSAVLVEHNIPQPEVRVAFTEESALKAIEEMGYPVVLKPAVGSWGRLISKINDRDAAEALLEHKKILGSYHHSIFYIQKFIETGGRDIRAFVVDKDCIAAIYRNSDHWITNTARGGIATKCEVTPGLNDIAVRAAKAVGGDVVAVDIFETDDGYLVNEVNYTMEFKNSITVTGVNIPSKIVDYVIKVAGDKKE